MKILIINSDSPNNRGDRAILAGNICLIRETWPEAEIWALSEYAERDTQWYGINFLPMSAYSIKLSDFIKLVSFSRKADYIFWGGGELLKDYTNKIGIVYWLLKILPISIVNRNIYGAFQGIGPTQSTFSKNLIAFLANRTKVFIVRDEESKQKLLSWGADILVIASYDPAVLSDVAAIDSPLARKLTEAGISEEFLANCAGVGVRKWFHYKKSTWLPFKFKRRHKKNQENNEQLESYTKNLADLCDWTIETHNTNLLFFPMHMLASENDALFSESVVSHMRNPQRVKILDKDIFSPQEYLNIIGACHFFIGSRLHSSILATSAGVPSLVYYYVDKGRLFFEQLNMQRFSQPIEELLDSTNTAKVKEEIDSLINEKNEIKTAILTNITGMKSRIRSDFKKALAAKHDEKS